MKLRIITDKTRDEEIIIFAHERNDLVNAIEKLVSESNHGIIGYADNEAKKINLLNVNCFISECNKVYALTEEKLIIKERLYRIEEKLDDDFIKINQSCIANIKKISKVQATFSGAFSVTFENGYTDFISRRNLKKVKERLGVRL